jgi:IS30 family transposase
MSYRQLSQEERYTITALRISRKSNAEIARVLQRSASTICRELLRNRKPSDLKYRAEPAHSYATARRRRERRGFRHSAQQWHQVIALLQQKWSPEQISNYLRLQGSFSISHETIYQYVWADKWVGGSLYKHLRLMPKLRRKRRNSKDSRGILPGKRHISQRPAAVETRRQFGHWEGDTVVGKDLHHCILTLVERQSGLTIIRKMPSRTAPAATQAALSAIGPRAQDFRTITLDNGTEFHDYKAWEQHFPLKCYFATPYHSWERGSNENLNGLIRQYLPKGMSFTALTQTDCDSIASQLNTRPRKRHGYRTPLEVYRNHSRSLHFDVEPKPFWGLKIANFPIAGP